MLKSIILRSDWLGVSYFLTLYFVNNKIAIKFKRLEPQAALFSGKSCDNTHRQIEKIFIKLRNEWITLNEWKKKNEMNKKNENISRKYKFSFK